MPSDQCTWIYILYTVHGLCTVKAFLFRYKRMLVIVSHSQDFLNGVCTNIIHMQEKGLKYYGVCMSWLAGIVIYRG